MQQYVYTLFNLDLEIACGVSTTFQKAYEKIEESAREFNAIAIIDVSDAHNDRDAVFEVILKKAYGFQVHKYVISRSLLTVWPNDMVISTDMIDQMKEGFKNRGLKNKYKTIRDVI